MEDILLLYAETPDPHRPRVCVDEVPYQLLGDVHPAHPAAPGHPARIDHEYVREGTCCLFMIAQPEAGTRRVVVRERRTAKNFAHLLKLLVDDMYPHADVIRLVVDNLNTHRAACLYEAFPPAEARRIAQKLEWHYTPKHASWLNMAESENSVMSRQCLDRRIATPQLLAHELARWQEDRNAAKATITWRFTCEDARSKLSRLYPSLEDNSPG
jgi:hypothetical protein